MVVTECSLLMVIAAVGIIPSLPAGYSSNNKQREYSVKKLAQNKSIN